MKLKKTMTSVVLVLLGLGGYAQENSVAGGGKATGTGGTSSYSIGQVVYTVNSDINTSITQGVQQPYEISEVTGLDETTILLNMDVYPNPTTNFISLEIENKDIDGLSYQLFDFHGKSISTTNVSQVKTTISMVELPKATYFLNVVKNNQTVKIFKIIKN
jgi:hypothetical protein